MSDTDRAGAAGQTFWQCAGCGREEGRDLGAAPPEWERYGGGRIVRYQGPDRDHLRPYPCRHCGGDMLLCVFRPVEYAGPAAPLPR